MDLLQFLGLIGGLVAVHTIIAFALPSNVALPILFFLLIVIAMLTILLVLFRPSEGGGLAGAFGGMGSDNTFGVRSLAVIDKVIVVISTLFLTNAILIGILAADPDGIPDGGEDGTFHHQPAEESPEPVALVYLGEDDDSAQ